MAARRYVCTGIEPDPCGDFVHNEDHAAVEAERDQLLRERDEALDHLAIHYGVVGPGSLLERLQSTTRLVEGAKVKLRTRVVEAEAAAEAAKEAHRPLLGPLPGMVAGYWFEPSAVIPSRPPDYAPSSALLSAPSGGRAPALVLVERAGEWFPMSEAASLTYSFTRAGAGVRFVAWGPQGRLVQRSQFVLVEAGTVGRLYGREVAVRCYGDRRVVGAVPMAEPVVEDREPDLSGVTAESIAEALSPAPASPAVPPGPPQPLATPWISIRAAADLLSMTEGALRKALERRAERRGDTTVADLNGIRGRKMGSRWRVSLAALDYQIAGTDG